jgi:hypothetical protein
MWYMGSFGPHLECRRFESDPFESVAEDSPHFVEEALAAVRRA